MKVYYRKYDLLYRELNNWNTDNYINRIYYEKDEIGNAGKPGVVSPVSVKELRHELDFEEK